MAKDSLICYHCGLPAKPTDNFCALVLGTPRTMCCPGCKAVAEAIVSNGLEDYYRYRTENAITADDTLNTTLEKLSLFDDPKIQQEFVDSEGENSQIELTISGISCAACGWLIEKQLSKIVGIQEIAVNVAARRAFISWIPGVIKLSEIFNQIERVGYHASPFQVDRHEALFQAEHKTYLKRLGLAGIITMQVMMLALAVYFDLFGDIDKQTLNYFNWVSLCLTTPVVVYSASGFYANAFNALRLKMVNMDVPISIALLGTYLAGLLATVQQQGQTYFESVCMFVFLLLVGRYLEHAARYKATQLSANMLRYMPVTAMLMQDNTSSPVLAKSLMTGQLILVKAGETIPVDGQIIKGQGQVDESMMTGEFVAQNKISGDKVFGGTINQLGTLTLRVTASLKHSMISQIARIQAQAMANRPRIATLADRVSQYFVVVVLVIAAASYFFWSAWGNDQAFWICISVLIATCPCALGLATPTALTCAMAKLNRQGVLLRRSDALEQLNLIDQIMLDKTGTLTEGKFSIQHLHNVSSYSDEQIKQYAASLERYSSHPISKAFEGVPALEPVDDFSSSLGLGIEGHINGDHFKLGSASFMNVQLPQDLLTYNVFLQRNTVLIAAFSLTDVLRSDVKQMLSTLKDKKIALLSGDGRQVVSKIAEQLSISDWYAEKSPLEKLQLVKIKQQQGRSVLMLGDGINDGPVLAQADVSVALGGGSDLAKSSADVILLNNSLYNLSELFVMAKRCRMNIKQNIIWAISYNVLILPLAVSGLLSPWMAVIGMSLSSLIVVGNSVRLLK
ncbi:MAG: Cu2+-exporting ATPase [Paraglaciecola sp.]|jgi:Cu2+-exporting ATPase